MHFSIIIPAFNSEKYISTCLNSCLSNTEVNSNQFEIIVVDDGSVDNTVALVIQYQARYSNIKLISKLNGGVSSARNLGVENSSGDYILFVDADDEIAANSLSKLSLYIDEFSQTEILILNSVKIKSKTEQLKMYPYPNTLRGKFWSGVELFKSGYLRGSVCGVMFKKTFLNKNKIRFVENIKNGEDALFMTVSFMYVEIVDHLDLDFYFINETEDSASRSWTEERVFSMVKSLNSVHTYLNDDLSDDQKAMLNIKAYGIISNAFFYYAKINVRPKGLKIINNICKNSGMYPIETYGNKHFKQKIIILNFSLSLFYYLSVIRNKYDRLRELVKFL